MKKPKTSKKRAKAFSLSLFFLGLAIISLLNQWWPGIMLVIGIPLSFRQYLLSKFYDMLLTLFIFVGTFVVAAFDFSWEVLLPILFVTAALYLICKTYFEEKETTEEEREQDINCEIEEDQK